VFGEFVNKFVKAVKLKLSAFTHCWLHFFTPDTQIKRLANRTPKGKQTMSSGLSIFSVFLTFFIGWLGGEK
jgi:hypothetical protein